MVNGEDLEVIQAHLKPTVIADYVYYAKYSKERPPRVVAPRTMAPPTPLISAVFNGDLEAVEKELAAGADVNLEFEDVRIETHDVYWKVCTAMTAACSTSNLRIVQLVSSYGASRTVPFVATTDREPVVLRVDAAQMACNMEIKQWLVTTDGYTPLHHLEVLTVKRTVALLQAGDSDSIFVAAADGSTPLSRARLQGREPPPDPRVRAGSDGFAVAFECIEWRRRMSVAQLVTLSAWPWSPKNECLFPIKVRESAQFLKMLHRRDYRDLPTVLWVKIMILALSRAQPVRDLDEYIAWYRSVMAQHAEQVNSLFQQLTL